MKIKYILSICFCAVLLSSCGGRYNNAEELTVPILQAVKSGNAERLISLQPPVDKINPIFANNKGTVGWCYYNKYTMSYREEQLKARMHTDMDIIKTISADNKLDWDNVEYSAPQKEDVQDSLSSSYSIVTTHLKFPSGGTYELKYHAVNDNGKWYLLDDVYFGTPQQASK